MKRSFIQRAISRLARDFSLPVMLEMPRIVWMVPTYVCNLRCRACPKTHNKMADIHMSPETYRRVREQAYKGAEVLHMQGIGEPALAPLFAEMLRDASRLDIPVRFVTNATKLTDEHIGILVSMRADVCVSIDGATAESHEYSRPGSKFSQVQETLDKLKQARSKHGKSRMSVHFSTVLTRRNVAEVPDLLVLAKRYGVERVVCISPGVGPRQDEFALETISYHEDVLRSLVGKMRAAERDTGVRLILPPYAEGTAQTGDGGTGPPRRATLLRRRRIFPRKCFAPFNEIYIEPDGWIRPCCVVSCISMGNILQDDLRKIWNNRHYRLLRRTINSNNPPLFCRYCGFNGGIAGGDERFLEKMYAQGLPPLPPPPPIGYYWSEGEKKVLEY